jgi:hypothetical protein
VAFAAGVYGFKSGFSLVRRLLYIDIVSLLLLYSALLHCCIQL